MIDYFRGVYGFLSNFYNCPITHIELEEPYEKIVYGSVEHYYQAMKSKDIKYRLGVAQAKTPAEAKKMGKNVELRPDWNATRIDVMRWALWLKFRQPILKIKLIMTDPYKLVEGNTWGDTFWGVCKGHGENILGELLMELREVLIEDPDTTTRIYTAQYKYNGIDRLDITAARKDSIGKVFAPPWVIVKRYQNNEIDADTYTKAYHDLMVTSYKQYPQVWEHVLSSRSMTFICFCKPTEFCHRVLLAGYFKSLGAKYAGERSL
jgi:hypothetical protein